jgi:DNA polymerase-3 subunit delta'
VGAREAGLINVTHEGTVRELAARMTISQTVACVDALSLARERLAANVQPVLALEALVLALRPRPVSQPA